ncbi:hypothetical protein [Marmoricola sp. RAF53]|uniref:hypothetical protein n=1 Tax=Marmoricola sp. RAF53 TaxID=3233059 RepID=UPI003F969387
MRRCLLGVLLLLATGCGGTPSPGAAPSASPTPAAPARPALQVAEGNGSMCLERVQRRYDFAYWSEPVTATQPLEITGVRAEGTGVRVVDGQVAPVVGGAQLDAVVSDWPYTPGRDTRRSVEWRSRTALVGAQLPVQRAMLPFLHFRAVPGGNLTAVLYDYRTADGVTGVARAPLEIRISARGC